MALSFALFKIVYSSANGCAQVLSLVTLVIYSKVRLPYLKNKNRGGWIKFEFQINNESLFSINM